ncbi:hypothetical protein EUX98_g3702 [Antrodiella citrinella]|uniref:FAD/NAD(P)-binding domain-containing protein n=1 Tax=Antrodiella citrinella TaxID=2447956 RepID=A0A4S4MVW0_9APHY|nr:hypothetical protein EUX98_g3702 [Antrodiella citrinella]
MVHNSQTDPRVIALAWLKQYGAAILLADIPIIASLFLPHGWFRDVLTFTWDTRSLEGTDKISAYFSEHLKPGYVSDMTLFEDLYIRPSFFPVGPHSGVEVAFSYDTPIAHGQGFARLMEDGNGEWKALSVCMFVADLRGHEETNYELGIYGGHTLAWADVYAERRAKIESEPQILIVGAGQIGLMLAAVCKQMNLRALVIERTERVGDIWRQRYPTLAFHTTRRHHEMLYQPYPPTWPLFTPKDKFADWLEGYVKFQDLVVWTSSQIDGQPLYHDDAKRWDVTVRRNGKLVTVNPSHVIIATGVLGEAVIPVLPGKELFSGSILQGHYYQGGPSYAGQNVVVVGAGNTAIDICQDLWFHKAKSVTMTQRSSTCIIAGETASRNIQRVWADQEPAAVGDLKFKTMPLGLLRKLQQSRTQEMWDEDKEMFEGLQKAGLKLNMGPDGAGQLLMVWERCGGYWVDKGGAKLIANGGIKVKQGHEATAYTKTGLQFADGTELEADSVIFAIGYTNVREVAKKIFGEEAIKRTGEVYGLDDEGELKGSFRPSGHPGLWFGSGEFITGRTMAKQLKLV